MNKRLFGYIGFACTSAAMCIVWPVDNNSPLASTRAVLSTAHDVEAVTADAQLASSSIFPVVVPRKPPMMDMVNIAAEAGLRKALPAEGSPGSQERQDSVKFERKPTLPVPEKSAASPSNIKTATDVPVATSQPVKTRTFLSNEAFATPSSSAGFLSRVTAVTALHTREFSILLKPNGFHRAHWQDFEFGAYQDNHTKDAKPFIVMIDPGHGGSDPGTKGHNGLLEKHLTLDIARKVRLFLTEIKEIDVQLTRNHDYGLSRRSRVDAIKRSQADLVISLHFNHLPQTDVNLVESFYAGPENIHESRSAQRLVQRGELHRTSASNAHIDLDLSFTEGSARLAKDLQQRVFAEVSFENEHAQNAGVKKETLFVLTQSYTPSALLEISCLSHADEADRLASEEYRNRLAAALVDGIRNYHDSLQTKPLKKPGDLGV